MRRDDERGFTIVEVLIAMFLFSILSIGFYQVMFSAVRGSNDATDVAQSAEEARLGFNRMIRDTRETTQLVVADDDSYRIWIDFDRDDLVDSADLEYVEFAFDGEKILLTALDAASDPALLSGTEATLAGTEAETLASNIELLDPPRPVFSYASNYLAFDASVPADGDVTAAELDDAPGVGDNNDTLSGLELDYISEVNYSFVVSVGGKEREFFGQASIRNRRYSEL